MTQGHLVFVGTTLPINCFICFVNRRRQNAEADWNEYKAEEDHREEMRRKQESRKKSKLVWDDEEERKCQQRYRKKYKNRFATP